MEYNFKDIDIGDIRLAYIEQGHGIPVVFVHGGGPTDLRTWSQQIEPFSERYRVIAYSRRYHYPNPWGGVGPDLNSTIVQAGDLAALVKALRLGHVHLIGFSFGADIALRAAVDHPELLRSLVVVEPALISWLTDLPTGVDLFANFAREMLVAKKAAQSGDLEQGVKHFMDALMGAGTSDEIPPSILERLRANARLIAFEPTEISDAVSDITRIEAAAIQTPTLMLTGDESPEWLLLVSEELKRCLRNVELAKIRNSSHLLHVMNPPEFNTAVLTFLDKHSS